MPIPKEKRYTVEEFYSMKDLPERCELIDGHIIDMSPSPNLRHQNISVNLATDITNYIRKNKGKCKVFPAPADVKLENGIIVQPDIYVTCDPNKLNGQYHDGAPDWVIEILSPSTAMRDCIEKRDLYKSAGVREYWIVDPDTERVSVFPFGENGGTELYKFDDDIPVHIYKDDPEPLKIRIGEI